MNSVDDLRTRVRARVWQAFAQADIDTVAVPKSQMEPLVDEITDGVLLELDATLDRLDPQREMAAPADAEAAEERVLWTGRPFLALNERYVVTTERVRIIRGLLSRDREEIELVRVQDIDHSQSVGERLLDRGDIVLRSADPSEPVAVLRNVRDPERVHEIIRRAMLEARRRTGFAFREEM